MTERAVFLTGGSGLVGAEVVSQLRAADRRVIVLTHRKQTIVDSAGRVAGVVFAASVTDDDTGYALTAEQVADAAADGTASESEVSTQGCAG